MPQLAGRSQSGGGALGDSGGHFLNTPQMQRSTTSPYGGQPPFLPPLPLSLDTAPNQPQSLYAHQLPPQNSRMTHPGPGGAPGDERLMSNGNGPSAQQQINMSYGMPPRVPPQQQLSQQSDGGLQYDNSNFPSLSGGQQTRYPMMSQHQAMVGAQQGGGLGRLGEDEYPNLNEDDFPALPGSSSLPSASSHKLRGELTGEELSHSSSHDHFSNGAAGASRAPSGSSFYSSGGSLHPPSPGLYPSSNSTPNLTPNRPKASALSPKLQPSGDPLRPEAKYGLLGLLDVIRLTDRVSLPSPPPSLPPPLTSTGPQHSRPGLRPHNLWPQLELLRVSLRLLRLALLRPLALL
jgi:hypothetical protein